MTQRNSSGILTVEESSKILQLYHMLYEEANYETQRRVRSEDFFILLQTMLVITEVGIYEGFMHGSSVALLNVLGALLAGYGFLRVKGSALINSARFKTLREYEIRLPMRIKSDVWERAQAEKYTPAALSSARLMLAIGCMHIAAIVVLAMRFYLLRSFLLVRGF
jgi:hypothetical protein